MGIGTLPSNRPLSSHVYSIVPCDINPSNHVVQQIFVDEGSRDNLSIAFEFEKGRILLSNYLGINRTLFHSIQNFYYDLQQSWYHFNN